MHNTNLNMDNDNRTLKIYMKKEKFDGLKYPAVINFPYVESFGMMLLQFLNADFSTFDKWKKEAQARIKLFKQGKLEEEKLYNWMIENK